MKTPEEFLEDLKTHPDCRFPDPEILSWGFLRNFIEVIQLDAIGATILKNSDKELATARAIASNERIRADQLHEEMIKMRAKWHEARKHLRAANKGAERNNMVMRLQAQTINEMLLKTKQ